VTWEALNLASSEFAQASEPPAVCGLIYAGKRHVVSGPPESAKTLLAFIVALEHSRAGFGGWAHVDFEMGAVATRGMLEDLGASIDEVGAVFHFEPDGPPTLDDVDSLAREGVRLAIVDAAAGAFDVSALDDNKRADAERFAAAWIKPLWDRGITTIVLDHVTKNADTRGKFSIGSERKVGQADVHLGLEPITSLSRGGSGLYRITTHKDRPGHLARPRAAELELASDPVTHAITWTFKPAGAPADDNETWRPTFLIERVLSYLRDQAQPRSRNDIAAGVTGKRAFVLQAIDCAVADGDAVEVPGPRGKLITINPDRYPVPDRYPPVPGNHSSREPVPGSHSLQREPVPGTSSYTRNTPHTQQEIAA